MKRLGLVLLGLSTIGYAAETTSELSPKPTNHEVLLSATNSSLLFTDSSGSLGFTSGYNYSIHPHWQLGFFPSVAVGYATGDIGLSYRLSLDVGPTLNFSEDFANSFFLRTTVGHTFSGLTGRKFSESLWGVQASVGKRFQLTENLTYTPSLGVSKFLHSEAKATFIVNVLSFSAVF